MKTTRKCKKLDVNTFEWLEMPDLNIARANCVTLVIKNRLFVFQGESIHGQNQEAYRQEFEIEYLDLSHENSKWVVYKRKDYLQIQ